MRAMILIVCFLGPIILLTTNSGSYRERSGEILTQKNQKNNEDEFADIRSDEDKTTSVIGEVNTKNHQYNIGFMEGILTTDVYLISSNDNGSLTYKLGFMSDKENYQYCKIESLNGKLSNYVIKKFQTSQYFINLQDDKTSGCADILEIKYYDKNDKLLGYKEKYVYWDNTDNSFYTVN